MKYFSEIVSWGDDALFFLEDDDANFIILFNEDAPPELAEISVLHTKTQLLLELEIGDTMIIAEKVFEITAIGDEAASTLKELGHCTLCFKGGDVPDRPGCIMLKGDQPLLKQDIQKGQTIEIH